MAWSSPWTPRGATTFTGLRGVGSLPYTPLEQYGDAADHTDVRSDIYALGATLYHLLTGSEPPSAQEVFLNADALVPPRRINASIRPQTEGAILAAMASHPRDSPPTVAAWRALLRPGDPNSQAVTSAGKEMGQGSVWRANRWLILFAALLTILVLYLSLR